LFADADLRAKVKTRYDAQVNWDWVHGSPDPLVPVDSFSVRWQGWLKAPRPGRYTLALTPAGVGRLWLDGKFLLGGYVDMQPLTAEVELTDRPHELRVEYARIAGNAAVWLRWAQAGGFTLRPVPPAAFFHGRAAAQQAAVPQDGGPAGPR
jgi:hypothetical protein